MKQAPSRYAHHVAVQNMREYNAWFLKQQEENKGTIPTRSKNLYAFELMRDHAAFWELQTKPDNVPWGKPQQCFLNALILAGQNREYTYVEGHAWFHTPIHHAWVVDRNGRVIDNTWDELGACYHGTPFHIADVLRAAEESDTSSLMFNPKLGPTPMSYIDRKTLEKALCN